MDGTNSGRASEAHLPLLPPELSPGWVPHGDGRKDDNEQ